jgi:phosphate/sulfate permease
LPGKFALSPQVSPAELLKAEAALQTIEMKLVTISDYSVPKTASHFLPAAYADTQVEGKTTVMEASQLANGIRNDLLKITHQSEMKSEEKLALRKNIYSLDSKLTHLEKAGYPVAELKPLRKTLSGMVEYAPLWVIVMIAISLGLGTMIGWKRVVETLGEKIGTSGLTYAQGTVSQAVAMSMIGVSALAGVPVSTTHCLSSGIAGSMVASGSSVQKSTLRSIGLAWVLTLPVTLALSCGLFLVLKAVFIA